MQPVQSTLDSTPTVVVRCGYTIQATLGELRPVVVSVHHLSYIQYTPVKTHTF